MIDSQMKSNSFSISTHIPLLFLLLFLGFFAHLGNIPLFDSDEGLYSEVTREMLANQDFTKPLLNGIPFPLKPPLFFWAQAASIKIFGLNEFAMRLPSALAALLWAVSLSLFSRRYCSSRTAWYTSLFMASSLIVILIGRSATPEALANLFIALTCFNIYKYYHTGNKRHVYWLYMFSGLGVLTKGMIGLIIPLAAGLLFFGMQKRLRDFLRLLFNPVGIIVFTLIVAPWFWAEFMLYGKVHMGEMLLLPSAEIPNIPLIGSSLSYYLYPLILFAALLPNSFILIKSFSRMKSLLSEELLQFFFLWAFAAILLLPLVQPRSPTSIAYCCTPLFLIMAHSADEIGNFFTVLVWPLLLTVLLFLATQLVPHIAALINNEFIKNAVVAGTLYLDTFYRLSLAGIILLLALLPLIKALPLSFKYAVLSLIFVSMTNFLVLPIIGNILQQPVKFAALLAKKERFSVVTWLEPAPSFNVYAEMLTAQRSPQPGDIVLMKTVLLDDLASYEPFYEKNGVTLARVRELQNR
jgi:4-amino-4-deoxy-L-arabinose transferase-like glycosyltransferase